MMYKRYESKVKMLVANPPAYIQNLNRHFVQAGSRWSFSMNIAKEDRRQDHYLPYPFFLAYSSALLKRDVDVEVKALDACALDFDEKEFGHYVASFSPDVLVLEVPTVSFPLVMDVVKDVKEDVACKLVVAGPHATVLFEEVMKKYGFIDYCLLGEYEVTLKELTETLRNGKDDYQNLKKIEGLSFRHNGNIVVNRKRNLLKDLDYLPFPDRNELSISDYHDFEIAGKPCAQMLTSRGCPSGCTFCLDRHVMYASPAHRERSSEKVVDEMMLVKEKHGAKQVYFDDETMCISRKHVKSLCDEMIRRRADMPWSCMGDITLDFDTLKLMSDAGCVGVKFGVESVNTKTLNEVKKSFLNLDKVRQFVDWCKKLNLWSHATYTIGLPGDNRDDILNTLKFAVKLDTDSAQFSIATPFPGTPFFEMARENGWLTTFDWTMYDGANFAVLNYPWLKKEEIEALYRGALKKFYKWALLKSFVKPRKVIKLLRAGSFGYAARKAITATRAHTENFEVK